MFEEIISDYINILIGKIEDIQTFGNIINLIEINRIKEEKQRDYFRTLKDKYKHVIENDIKNIKSKDQLNKAVSITAEFVSRLFLYEKNTSFIDDEIKKLEYRIKSLIYIELLTKYKGEDYKKLKEYIYDIYLKNLDTKEGRDDIIKLVKKLTGEEKKFFIQEMLLKECVFSKEEFYSNQENYKIKTLYELKKDLEAEQFNKEKEKKDESGEKGEDNTKKEEEKLLDLIDLNALSERGNDIAKKLRNTLDSIRKELENMSLIKKDLEKFLKIKRNKNQIKDKEDLNKISEKENKNINEKIDSVEKEVLIKLELISLVLSNYNSEKKYDEYKLQINNINEKLDKLNETQELLLIFHKNKYKDDINEINKLIGRIENNTIIDFKKDERQKEIQYFFDKHNILCDDIKKVKDFLLFKKIFENARGSDQLERFEDATKKLKTLKNKLDGNEDSTEKSKDSKSEKGKSDEKKIDIEIIFNEKEFINIFRDIKEELSHKNESESQLFTKQMIDYFDIKNESVKNDLKMLINSKKYENIVKSIKYFFDNFSNKKINLPKNLNLSEYSLKELKNELDELKTNDIYDYTSKSQYYKIFTSMNEKKEAIDFLMKHIKEDRKIFRNKLIENLDPTNRSILIDDIDNANKCLELFQNLINKDTSEIMKHIKKLSENEIKQFVIYSNKFGSIIELANKDGKDNFSEVYEIINSASLILIINLDGEDFKYTTSDGKDIKIENIDYLNKLKSKINLQSKQNNQDSKEKNGEKVIKDLYELKCDKLLFFKDEISNLDIIYDKINILREKGFNIPIVINVSLEYPKDPKKEKKAIYKLNYKEQKLNEINKYLSNVKNVYETELSKVYESKKHLRLLYGNFSEKSGKIKKVILIYQNLKDIF